MKPAGAFGRSCSSPAPGGVIFLTRTDETPLAGPTFDHRSPAAAAENRQVVADEVFPQASQQADPSRQRYWTGGVINARRDLLAPKPMWHVACFTAVIG